MSAIDFGRMERVLTRCGEIAEDASTKQTVKTVYADHLEAVAKVFLDANTAIAGAETAFRKEHREALENLDGLDQPYREARAVYLTYHKDAVVPETLKAQPTDTDRKNAISHLLDLIDDHAGEKWADDLLAGPFGQKAGPVIQELDEATAANAELSHAQRRRAEAFGAAYVEYLAFKNVVRNAHGPKSPQYRRIHIRQSGALGDEPPASTGG